MPSAGMRRTTRVFGARVLRSGRKLWTPSEGKQLKKAAINEDKLIKLLNNSEGHAPPRCKSNGYHQVDGSPKHEETNMDLDVTLDSRALEPELEMHTVNVLNENSNVNTRWGVVYRRKRNRTDRKNILEACDGASEASKDRRFGKYFVRKRSKKKARISPQDLCTHSIIINSAHSSGCFMGCLLHSLLSGMHRASVTLAEFFAFINSSPICDVFSLHGVLFLKECTPELKDGICMISSVRCSVPLFTVNYSAIPFCFTYLHCRMSLKCGLPSYALSLSLVAIDEDIVMHDISESNELGNPVILPIKDKGDSMKLILTQPMVRLPKLPARNSRLRSGRTLQKRRRPLRTRRVKRSSVNGLTKPNGTLASDGSRFRHNSSYQLLSSAKKFKELKKSAVFESTKDIESTSCSANVLVIESDKCFRVEGAIIALELLSASNQWTLSVSSGGIRQYSLTAEKVMRPCSSNRVTHDILWTVDNSWKLEFPNRRDWWVFKELYKECAERNAQPSIVSTIPIPGVCELSGFWENGSTTYFSRPDPYITVKTDELGRALDSRMAIYDLDSDDEEWLNEFNNKLHQCVSIEKFELMIDSLEKWRFCNPDDVCDGKTALSDCLGSESKDIAEAVHGYWIKKRKLKRAPLVKIFQLYQPRKTVITTKSILRKKRSFKRQGGQTGRGKKNNFLQVLAAQRDAEQQQSAILKVKEAKASATRQEGLAVVKRHKAQQLMENADLATYKAMMALRIAEAAARLAAGNAESS
ncbi:unnamed protein product [Cuscuta europaea]|uniref:Enhancer of polycomb-like protein n=1 Tax=Cuscuta europaea TaxID=41803 RepID=A0A9P0ZW84_CUSEU|nr:unnamed protein product [Cuscuta europaea]